MNLEIHLNHFDTENEKIMAEYSERKRLQEDMENEVKEQDDDGWTTVVKKFKPTSTKVSKKLRAKKRQMQHINFYSFQEREKKMKSKYLNFIA